MFTLALFHASLAGNTGLTQLNAMGDDMLATSANGYVVSSRFPKLMRASGVGALLMRAQLNSGKLRDLAPLDLAPVNVGTAIAIPRREQDWSDNPLDLSPGEELDANILNSGVGPTRTTVACWFADGPVRKAVGRIQTVRFTNAATAAVAFAWTSFQPVFDNPLDVGTYAIVGSRMQSTTALFHRWFPRGGDYGRPGTYSGQGDGDAQDSKDRYGALGEWCRFTLTTVPQCQVFCLAADAAATMIGYLDIIKVG